MGPSMWISPFKWKRKSFNVMKVLFMNSSATVIVQLITDIDKQSSKQLSVNFVTNNSLGKTIYHHHLT